MNNPNKKFQNQNINCVVCALYPTYKFAFLFGISIINCKCPHVCNSTTKPSFQLSKTRRLMKLATMAVLLLQIIFYVYFILSEDTNLNRILETISELLFAINSFFTSAEQINKGKMKVSYLNSWIHLIEKCGNVNLKIMLSAKSLNHFKVRGNSDLIVVTVLAISGFVYESIVIEHSSWNLLNAGVTAFATYFHMVNMMQLASEIKLTISVLKSWKKQLEISLNERMSFKQLKGFQRTYLAIIRTQESSRDYINPGAIIFFIMMFPILIINCYLLLFMMINGTYNNLSVILQLRSYVIIFGMLYYIYYADVALKVNRQVMSVLYRCPVSNLIDGEAEQLESLLTTVRIQKPTIKASDFFTMGIGLLATMSGAVITYVLVALQFRKN